LKQSSDGGYGIIRHRVNEQQRKAAEYHDKKYKAQSTVIKVGDWVRIKLPAIQHKLARPYSSPAKVIKVNATTVWLADGKRWNMRRVLKVTPPGEQSGQHIRTMPLKTSQHNQQANTDSNDEQDGPTFSFTSASTIPEPVAPRRSTRIRAQRDFGPALRY
jgi:hypothetical protein